MALSGLTVAVKVRVSPSVSVAVVLSNDTPVTGYTFALTVTEQVAVLLPSSVVTVIVAVPAFNAVTLPLETVATEVLLLFQLTFLLVALLGLIVAVRVNSSPSVISQDALSRVTSVTGYTFALTVTEHVAIFPPSSDFTVIVALPGLIAVTTPSFTDATDELLDDHITFWFSAFEGDTVAIRVCVSPSTSVIDVEFSVTAETAIGAGSSVQLIKPNVSITKFRTLIKNFFIFLYF